MDQQVSSDAYILLKRFSMPRGNGTEDAVALTQSHGLIVVSLYTMMMKAIITQFWAGLVIIGVGIYLRKYPPETITELTATIAGVWNTRRSPRAVAILAVRQLYKMRNDRQRWHPLLWAVLAAMIVAASLVVPILKTTSLQIGTVAPVNGNAIFVPQIIGIPYDELGLAYLTIAPAAFRAVSSVGKIPQNTVFFNATTQGMGNITINYSYGISGADFGLTKTPELGFNVTGYCFTDYSWYIETADNDDIYAPFEGINVTVSGSVGGPPYAQYAVPDDPYVGQFNYTFGLVVSSIGRYSFTQGTDPWYLTNSKPNNDSNSQQFGAFLVINGRPGLSCSESAVWSYRGKTAGTGSLANLTSPELSAPLSNAFYQYLSQSMVFQLSVILNRAALASATTTVGDSINANISGVAKDMSRLVNTAYMMTRNILSDSTQFDTEGVNISNIIRGPDQQTVLAGADEFVVSSPDIMTLSVRDLILIPALLGGVVVLVLIFAFLPEPWRKSEELNATELQKSKKPKKHHQGASKIQTHNKTVESQGDDEKQPTTNDVNDIEEV